MCKKKKNCWVYKYNPAPSWISTQRYQFAEANSFSSSCTQFAVPRASCQTLTRSNSRCAQFGAPKFFARKTLRNSWSLFTIIFRLASLKEQNTMHKFWDVFWKLVRSSASTHFICLYRYNPICQILIKLFSSKLMRRLPMSITPIKITYGSNFSFIEWEKNKIWKLDRNVQLKAREDNKFN